ncbi:MAG: hypothetical protein ABR921_02995 [Candidatus Sulfotelmatobacter sp.]
MAGTAALDLQAQEHGYAKLHLDLLEIQARHSHSGQVLSQLYRRETNIAWRRGLKPIRFRQVRPFLGMPFPGQETALASTIDAAGKGNLIRRLIARPAAC